jgi:ABC-type bacteriocin/lantibiotic exporter with double-glycine peptidase domain
MIAMTMHSVSLVTQTTQNTCWAASTAMLLNYRGGSYDDSQVVREMMEAFPGSTWNDGASEPELSQVAQKYSFTQVYPACWDAPGWDQVLQENGPLLIQVPGNTHHSIVVYGIDVRTNEQNEAERVSQDSMVFVQDPWYGSRELSFTAFTQEYELAGSSWNNNIYRT